MARIVSLIALLFLSFNVSAEFFGADVGGYVSTQKITDDHEMIQVGLTLEWSHVAVDISHGTRRVAWQTVDEPQWKMDEWQSGSVFSIRGYPFNFIKIRPLITWVHMSDLVRGRPFNDENEPTSDYMGVGFTIVWKRFELDVSTGITARECDLFFACGSNAKTHESQIQLRGYFWK